MRLTAGQLRQIIKEEVARVSTSRNGGNRRRLRENAGGADNVLYVWIDEEDAGYGTAQDLIDEISSAPEVLSLFTPAVSPVDASNGLEEQLTFDSAEAKQAFLACARLIGQENEFTEAPRGQRY
jgi:hypothetical protein